MLLDTLWQVWTISVKKNRLTIQENDHIHPQEERNYSTWSEVDVHGKLLRDKSVTEHCAENSK